MPTLKKEKTVEAVTELVRNSKSVVLTDYRGLTMKDLDTLRAKLRPNQVVFKIVKNTLLRRAAEGTALAEIAGPLEGPTAAAFSLGDSVAAAKLVTEFIKDTRSSLAIKSGVVEGQCFDEKGIQAIAKLPSKEVLVAQVIGSLQAPITNLAGTMQTMLSQLVWTLNSVAEGKA